MSGLFKLLQVLYCTDTFTIHTDLLLGIDYDVFLFFNNEGKWL